MKRNAQLLSCTFEAMDKNNKVIFYVMDWINVIQLNIDKGKTKYLKEKNKIKHKLSKKMVMFCQT
jgi:hypothetical protein